MKAIMQTLKIMLILAIFCFSAISANAQGSFFLSGTVRLGNGLGVPNWTVNVVEITAPTNT
jgi:ribosomal protein L16/L10AE